MIFLPIAVLLYYKIPQKWQKAYLLIISLYVYACFDVRAVAFLLIAIASGFISAKIIDSRRGKQRKNALVLCVLINAAMLIFFKYSNFAIETFNGICAMLGVDFAAKKLSLIAVTGISFFTFQTIGYVADVYNKKIPAETNLLDYSLFIAFFPHIVAGPISRGGSLLPQMKTPHEFDYGGAVKGLQLMALGFFKKVAVADVLAMMISAVFNDISSYSALMLIAAAMAYAFQLYTDFSGYSDIARGCAKVLGFDIIENFNTPFLAGSFKEFWNRWHISLSSWFGSYIYIPLGGSRKGLAKKYINLAVVFLVSGLWHGSSWNFVIWGALHGIFRIGEEALTRKSRFMQKTGGLRYLLGVIYVFAGWSFTMIFFRADTVQNAMSYISGLAGSYSPAVFVSDLFRAVGTGFDFTPILIFGYIAYIVLVLGITVAMDFYRCFALKGSCLTNIFGKIPQPVRLLCYYALIGLIMAGFIMQNGGYGASASFIYANF